MIVLKRSDNYEGFYIYYSREAYTKADIPNLASVMPLAQQAMLNQMNAGLGMKPPFASMTPFEMVHYNVDQIVVAKNKLNAAQAAMSTQNSSNSATLNANLAAAQADYNKAVKGT